MKNKRPYFLLLAMITLLFGCLDVVLGGEKTRTGKEVFGLNCRVCHLKGGNIMKPEKPMKGSEKLKSFEIFLAWIRNPVAPMPPFMPEQMPESEARTLYDYILSASENQWK